MELILKEKNKYSNISISRSSNVIKIKGLLGVTKASFGGPGIKIEDNKFFIWTKSDLRTFLSTFHNIIRGVQIGFLSEISLVGLGYRLFYENDVLLLKMGFGHYIKVDRPKDIHMFGHDKRLVIFGINKRNLNNFLRTLLSYQKINNYKSKGLFIKGVTIKLKEGKQKF